MVSSKNCPRVIPLPSAPLTCPTNWTLTRCLWGNHTAIGFFHPWGLYMFFTRPNIHHHHFLCLTSVKQAEYINLCLHVFICYNQVEIGTKKEEVHLAHAYIRRRLCNIPGVSVWLIEQMCLRQDVSHLCLTYSSVSSVTDQPDPTRGSSTHTYYSMAFFSHSCAVFVFVCVQCHGNNPRHILQKILCSKKKVLPASDNATVVFIVF